jgi:hypothetical protein
MFQPQYFDLFLKLAHIHDLPFFELAPLNQ